MEEILKYVWAFIVGGTICVIAQILIDKTILVLYATTGVVLTAIRVYEPLVQFAGAGATVPLTGFGYSLAKGVEKAVDERGLIGALTGGLTATSAGIAAAMCFGWIVSVCFKGKPKS